MLFLQAVRFSLKVLSFTSTVYHAYFELIKAQQQAFLIADCYFLEFRATTRNSVYCCIRFV
jgi:hypothetical protein